MPKLRLEVHPRAVWEADEAFGYYFERNPEAADRFLVELAEARAAIQNAPEASGALSSRVRGY